MSSKSRRKLLKSIAAGSGAIAVGKSLPESWSRPVVDSVMLPTHAQTSPVVGTHSGQTEQLGQIDTDSMFTEFIDGLVPDARANNVPMITYDHCITPNADRTRAEVEIVVNWVESSGCVMNAKFRAKVPVDTNFHEMTAYWNACRLGELNPRVKLTSLAGNAVGRFECGCGLFSDFDLGVAACNLASMPVCTGPCINCLSHDTPILTPGNHSRTIDSLQVGDIVTAIDQDGTSIFTVVTKVITQHMRADFYTINGGLRITDDHPVLVARDQSLAWCRVDNLIVGDHIRSLDGFIEIASLEYHDQPLETVYVETQSGNFVAMAGSDHYVVKSNYAEAADRIQYGELKTFA